ncbi:MAG: hypothetical protein AseanaTS_09750 [Candidatus Pelagadaptatus aseana]|uniref:hypothetical protein n=1 Tax=Candidatus Pelagadaptatus aseana TaxID=3120508 RepID=UPI0039B303A2
MKPTPLNRAFVSAFLIKGSDATLADVSDKKIANHGYTIERCRQTGKYSLNTAPAARPRKRKPVITEQEAREIEAVFYNP